VIPSKVRARSATDSPLFGYGIALLLYVVGAFAVMWHAWSGGLASRSVIPSGDPALFIWSFEYAANSVQHLRFDFTTPLLFHPRGFNVLANTTSLGIAIPFVPLTWLAGPVVSMNVALTLAPVVSGLAMVYALRRHHAWWPAAVVAGAIWGFSPFVLYGLNAGWLMIVFLAGPPLLWALGHELLVTRRRNPVAVGVLMAILCAWQFWVGSEILAMMCCVGVLIAISVLIAQLRVVGTVRRDVLVHVGRGVATAAVLSGLLLVVPAWWALHGSAHLGAWVWPRWTFYHDVTRLKSYVWGSSQPAGIFFVTLTGIVPNLAFVGFGIPLVLVVALVVAVRNGVLWLLAALAVLGVLLGLAGSFPISPFQVVYRLPVLHNILPQRWLVIAIFAGAMGVGIGVTELVTWVRRWTSNGALAGAALLALAMVPVAVNDASFIPLPVGPVAAPTWFSSHHGGGVLLLTPSPNSIATGLTWEAVSGLPTALVGGWGPEVHRTLSRVDALATLELWAVTVGKTGSVEAPPKWVRAVRRAAREWGVTDVLAAAPPSTPAFAWGRAPTAAVGLFVEAFGMPTSTGAGWWAWHLTPRSVGLLVTTSFSHRCNVRAQADVALVVRCLTGPAARTNGTHVRQG
jgi:hypothetical protein